MRPGKFIAYISLTLALALCLPSNSFGPYSISTIVGGGPNNLPALQSSIGFAGSVVLDGTGVANTYISDSYSSQIFKVSTSGTLTVVAGNGTMGYSGDGGLATSAQLMQPEGIFVDASGNIFIADTGNSLIREVVASTGNIQTVAGSFTAGAGYSGDGGLATSAQLSDPYGVFVDGQGNIFIADTNNNVIREVIASSLTIQTVAGAGTGCTGETDSLGDGCPATSALFSEPEAVYLDASGNIFIADTTELTDSCRQHWKCADYDRRNYDPRRRHSNRRRHHLRFILRFGLQVYGRRRSGHQRLFVPAGRRFRGRFRKYLHR